MTIFFHPVNMRYFILIESDSVSFKLHVLIHSIKNLILDLCLNDGDIAHPKDNIIYLEYSIKVLNKMCDSLKNPGILYLISSTGVILNKYEINENKELLTDE